MVQYADMLIAISLAEIGLVAACAFVGTRYLIATRSWRVLARYAIVLVSLIAYGGHLLFPSEPSLNRWLLSYHCFLASGTHLPVLLLLIDHRLLLWAVLGRRGPPPALGRITMGDVALGLGLFVGVFVFSWVGHWWCLDLMAEAESML